MIICRFKNTICKNRKGSSIVIFALALTVITAVTALTVDLGVVVLDKYKLSTAVDAAALAGAQELIKDKDNTRHMVEDYLIKNADSLKNVEININEASHIVEVKASKTVENFFAKLLGKNNLDISAQSKAKVANVSSLKGTRPFAVIQQDFIYGQLYTLKEGAGDGISGNYAAIALGGTGSSNYSDNILNSYLYEINTDDQIMTETGNMSGNTVTAVRQLIDGCTHIPSCTYTYYNSSCSRIITIPIVNTLNINGREYVKVLGFATFFLEGVESNAGHADIIGRFIPYNTQGGMSAEANDYGTYSIGLIK